MRISSNDEWEMTQQNWTSQHNRWPEFFIEANAVSSVMELKSDGLWILFLLASPCTGWAAGQHSSSCMHNPALRCHTAIARTAAAAAAESSAAAAAAAAGADKL